MFFFHFHFPSIRIIYNLCLREPEKAHKYHFKKLQQDAEKTLRNNWAVVDFPCNQNRIIIGQWYKLDSSAKKLIIDTDMNL